MGGGGGKKGWRWGDQKKIEKKSQDSFLNMNLGPESGSGSGELPCMGAWQRRMRAADTSAHSQERSNVFRGRNLALPSLSKP